MSLRSRSSPSLPRVSLQIRDLAIMESLVQLRAATLDDLHRAHFPGLSRKRAVNRLAQLARAGMLAPADVVLHDETATTRVYTLGPRARTALERRTLSSEHFRYRRWNPTLRDSSIPHQIVVNRLAGKIGGAAIPEHLLPVPGKNAARNRPDAVIEGVDVAGRARMLGLEVDLGHYSRDRIVGKAEAWRTYPEAGPLLIVVPDVARANKVNRWVRDRHNIHLLTVADLHERIDHALSIEGEGVFFGLDLWTGGTALDAERERQRVKAEEDDRLEAEETALYQARLERERREADGARAAENERRRQGARRGRRRFGV